MQNQKDVLRKFIEMKLPSLRKTSLKKEVEILEEFVNKRQHNPRSLMYSRQFLDKVKNAGYHLGRLQKAGALNPLYKEPVRVIVDLAEDDPNKRTKRGIKKIREVRQLRASKLVEHASKDGNVLLVVRESLGVSSIVNLGQNISYSENFGQERINHRNYNTAVAAIKESGLVPIKYDFLLWRNAAKPWKLTDDFVYYLIDKGIGMEV